MEYAQSSMEQDRTNEECARHFYEILFAIGMQAKADWHLGKYGQYFPKPASMYAWLAEKYLNIQDINKAYFWIQKAMKADQKDLQIQEQFRKIIMLRKN